MISEAQTIPNAGFETWTNMGTYGEPASWSTLNQMTSTASVFTAQSGAGNVGSYCIKLTSRNVTGMGVMPGVATSGTLNQTTFQPINGFAYNMRSANLTGKWQHMISGSSQGFVDVQLTRWDAGMNMRMPVATGHLTLSGMAMSWASFTVPLTYSDQTNTPDSCMITLSASGTAPTDGDYLWVDALAFNGIVAPLAVSDIKENENSIYPNPVTNTLNIKTNLQENEICIFDMTGKMILCSKIDNSNTINVSELAIGTYTYKLFHNKIQIATSKFSKQ
jgi:hypothetical protein